MSGRKVVEHIRGVIILNVMIRTGYVTRCIIQGQEFNQARGQFQSEDCGDLRTKSAYVLGG